MLIILLPVLQNPHADLLCIIQPHIVCHHGGSTSLHEALIFMLKVVVGCYKHPHTPVQVSLKWVLCTKGGLGALHILNRSSYLPLYFHPLQTSASQLPFPPAFYCTAKEKATTFPISNISFSQNSQTQHRRKPSCRKWASSVSHPIWSSFTETVDITYLLTSHNYKTNPLCSRDETCINSNTDVTWMCKCPQRKLNQNLS